jgi:hypothetical protein
LTKSRIEPFEKEVLVHPKCGKLISERGRAVLELYGVESGYWDEANHWYIGAVAPDVRDMVIKDKDKNKHRSVINRTSGLPGEVDTGGK